MLFSAPPGARPWLQSLLQGRAFWLALLLLQSLLILWLSSPWVGGDTPVYLRLADGVRLGCYGQFTHSTCVPDALRPPGYPLILAALSGLPRAIVVAFQLLVLGVAFLAIDRVLAAARSTQLAFRFLTLVYPFAAFYSASLQTEAWAMLLVTIPALLLCTRRLSGAYLLIIGALLGLAGLIRTDLVLLPLVASLMAVLLCRSWRAVLPLVAATAVLAPYVVWNDVHFSRLTPMPVASAVGNSLYLATWQESLSATDLDSLYSRNPTAAARKSGIVEDIASYNRSIGAHPSISPFNPAGYAGADQQAASSSIYRFAAVQRIAADPGAYAGHVVRNLWALWNSTRYPLAAAAPLLHLLSGLVYLLGLFGAVVAICSRSRFVPALAVMVYPMLVHLPFHTEARYTAAVRPLLLLFAAIALAWIWQYLLGGNRLDDGKVDGEPFRQADA